MTKEEVKALAIVALENCAALICFTLLAITFKKWWIVLLVLFFWKSFTYKSKDSKKGE